MSIRYNKPEDVPATVLADRLHEISWAIAEKRQDELTMRIPAEVDRDADIVVNEAARRLRAKADAAPDCDAVDLARESMELYKPGQPEYIVCAELVRVAEARAPKEA